MEPNDTTAPGHFQLMQERQMLYYLRLIDHELPKLVDFRKPFVPPSSSQPLSIRSVSYAEEDHPLARKRVVVVPVAWLPLKDKKAIHNIKVIAGVRWQKDPPAGSGFSESEGAGEHGYIKIACEDFPEPAMNLKWASDALDRLLDAANNGKDFSDIPVDTRHIQAKEKKAAKGAHAKGRGNKIPSLKDFPKEWLPKSPVSQPEEGARTSQ
ncbi:mitochondrial ribosomal subunit protein-domain-containing protein [Abortiporus biennis]|nr:mitochondrial ribosomal subunit protein-domain-containing protein [Abortiporus biennis]